MWFRGCTVQSFLEEPKPLKVGVRVVVDRPRATSVVKRVEGAVPGSVVFGVFHRYCPDYDWTHELQELFAFEDDAVSFCRALNDDLELKDGFWGLDDGFSVEELVLNSSQKFVGKKYCWLPFAGLV
jgi:hypothetical protein